MCSIYTYEGPSQAAQWQRIGLPMQKMQEMWVPPLDWEDALEKEMTTRSSSCLENPMDSVALRVTVHEITESQEQLSI